MRFGRTFYVIILALCLFEMARLWFIAPDQMAAHFNVQGEPDRFVSKAEFFWFQAQTLLVIILVSLPLQVLFMVMPPSLINMPNREFWLAPERQDETIGRLNSFGAMLFGMVVLMIQAAFEISAYANLRTPIQFNAGLMGAIMVTGMVVIGLLLLQLMISFRLPRTK